MRRRDIPRLLRLTVALVTFRHLYLTIDPEGIIRDGVRFWAELTPIRSARLESLAGEMGNRVLGGALQIKREGEVRAIV